ncbi:hypothetical protein KEJ45_06165 [Candidatus Bathyarchaeota archaeon]|nr:hypothetical protein [Candidatus Bathyarchaeota archaeon]
MREKWRKFSAAFLCLLMFSTPLTSSRLLAMVFQQPKVFIDSFTSKIQVEGNEFDALYSSEITEYPNGTKDIHLSITVENISEQFQKIRMNLTKSVTPSEIQNLKTNNPAQISSSACLQNCIVGTGNPYGLREETWDGLYALVAPGSDQYWIKYSHDNNLWRYYPILENLTNLDLHWEMKGTQKIHSHIGRQTLQDWIAGNITDEEAMRRIIGTRDLIISILGGAAISIFSYLYLSSLEGLIIGIVASIIISLILWFLSLLGVSKTAWLINTVEAEMGDGFCWAWGFRTTYFDAYCPDVGWLDYLNEYSAKWASEILSKYHRLQLLCYEAREFKMTWGVDRDESPQTYTAELFYDMMVPAGIFADYGSLSK